MIQKLALLGAVVVLAVLGVVLVGAARNVGVSQGYAPEQPIAFSHKIHAGDNHIPCLYCHFGAEKSRHAGIPPSNVCMNCHSRLRVANQEVEKLKEAVEQRRPIQWIKIHNLPDFVYFSHRQHVQRGVACQSCHGPVQTMERVRQEAPLVMGWCIDCHRRNGVTPDSPHRAAGAALASMVRFFPDPQDAIRAGETTQIPPPKAGTAPAIGGLDCSKCHY